jgi:hypothetical protein
MSSASSAATIYHTNMCLICRCDLLTNSSDVAEVSRGLERLIEAGKEHKDSALVEYLLSKPSQVKVHNSCRRNYTSKRRLSQERNRVDCSTLEIIPPKSLRSSSSTTFCWRVHCFFCGLECLDDVGEVAKPNMCIRRVKTVEIKDSILSQCEKRSDDWGFKVQGRLLTCCDLFAEEAVYHKNCHTSFFYVPIHSTSGRPVDKMKAENFEQICDWLEVNDTELVTLQDVVEKGRSLANNDRDLYSDKWIKDKLIERYGDHIQFCEVRGKRNVICWKDMAAYILNKKWHDDNTVNQTEHIVITAAKLLKTVIREHTYEMSSYPSCDDVSDPKKVRAWMPQLLQVFMDNFMCPDARKTSLGHCIVQAVRPRNVIAPLPFALGVTVDNLTASKFLLNLLHTMGMSVSYDEVRLFKQSVMKCDKTEQRSPFPCSFTQYAGDNVDHDLCTLDGSGTLHAMGIISISQSSEVSGSSENPKLSIPRVKLMKSDEVCKLNKIQLLPCVMPDDSCIDISFKPTFQSILPHVVSPSVNLDTLWQLGWFMQSDGEMRPSWGGFNAKVVTGNAHKASDIRVLPIIDSDPNSASCIYSTLSFVIQDSKKLSVPTPVITFDQPLWIKALKISTFHNLPIVCRLGTFHLQMSFLSSIGTLMDGSGLSDVLQCCYGQNTVKHILSGKAVARAVRGHFLVESALFIILLKNVLKDGAYQKEMAELRGSYSVIFSEGYNSETDIPESLSVIEKALAELKNDLMKKSRTAKLWLLYLDYISSFKQLLRAERTGDWQLHLDSIRSMINLFAATGHNNYAKCARLYVEFMSDLPDKFPHLHEQFVNGLHVARRSNKFWAGISTDLAIEQAMMRSVKSSGGLTHGRGSAESVRALWTATVHQTGSKALKLKRVWDFTKVYRYKYRNQCVDLTLSEKCAKTQVYRHKYRRECTDFCLKNALKLTCVHL